MKTFYIFILLLVASHLKSQNIIEDKTIKGNGKIIKKEISIKNITEIYNVSLFNIFLTDSNDNKLIIELDENLFDYITIKVKRKKLNITIKPELSCSPTVANIYLPANSLKNIVNMGSGNIVIKNIKPHNNLEISHMGSGKLIIKDFSVKKLEIANYGPQNVYIENITYNTLKVSNYGIGHIIIQTKNENITYKGLKTLTINNIATKK